MRFFNATATLSPVLVEKPCLVRGFMSFVGNSNYSEAIGRISLDFELMRVNFGLLFRFMLPVSEQARELY